MIPNPGLTLILASLFPVLAWSGEIVSVPMLGYRAHREVMLWLETKDAESVRLEYWLQENLTKFLN